MDITLFICEGKENARTRDTLCMLTGMTDRQVRRAIEDARNEGHFIVNDEDGNGYYMTNDVNVLTLQYRKDTSRAMAILKRRKHIRKYLKESGVQV